MILDAPIHQINRNFIRAAIFEDPASEKQFTVTFLRWDDAPKDAHWTARMRPEDLPTLAQLVQEAETWIAAWQHPNR